MMLKLLIAACLVTHGLGRPDVSHILKRDNQSGQQQQHPNHRAFHPLDYLNRQLGNGRQFEARAAFESEYNVFDYLTAINGTEINGLEGKSSPTIGRRNGARSFRNIVKPSPFKKNAAEFGYTYEKPVDPFDFPINPDANLIKPVSTQAPEYLPPLEQGPLAGADEQPGAPGSQRPTGQSVVSTTSPSYPELAPGAVSTEGSYGSPSDATGTPESPAVLNQNGYRPPVPVTGGDQGSSPSPIDISNQPDFTSTLATQSPQNAYDQQGSTMRPNEQTTAVSYPEEFSPDLKPTTEGEFTGYSYGPSSTPVPAVSATGFPQASPENQMTTGAGFTGYPQGPSSSPTPDQGSFTTGYPQAFSPSPNGQQTTTEGEFIGYPQRPSTTPSPDQGSTPGPFVSSTGYPQEPSPGINGQQPTSDNQFTGYPQGPSTTLSPDREPTSGSTPSSTDYPQESSTSSNGQQTGYPQGPSSSSPPEQGSFTQGYTPGPAQSSTGYPEGSTPSPSEFTGYPQGPSSTPSPDQGSFTQGSTPSSAESSTGYPQGPSPSPNGQQTVTENEFTGYPQGPSSTPSPSVPGAAQMTSNGYPQPPASSPLSENASTQKPGADFTVSTPTPLTTVGGHLTTLQIFDDQQGYNYEKPMLPPNLTEVIGEPIDINELATTTLPSTTTRKPSNGYILPPKPRPELVVPIEPSTAQTPGQTVPPATSSVETTSRPISPEPVPSSTSAPEYLPPEDANGPEQAYGTTQRPSADQTASTGAPSPGDTSESITAAGYPNYSQDATTFAGYPGSERETMTSSSYSGPIEETTTVSGYPDSSQESTTFSGYPSASQTTINASSYPSLSQETTPAFNYPSSVGQETTTFGGYPNAEVSTPHSGISTGAPEYTTPSSPTPSSDYQTTAGSSGPFAPEYSTGAGQPSTLEPFDDISAGGQPFPTRPNYESVQSTTSSGATEQPSSVTSSTAAPEYLPPNANDTSSQYYPPAVNTTADQLSSTPTPAYRPEISSDSQVNQTSPDVPDYTDFSQVAQPTAPQTPTNGMAITSEINGFMPDSGYLPPAGLRIVVDDTLSSNLFQPPSGRSSIAAPSHRPVPESDAEGSELQPRLALVASTSEGYNYQAPEERLPAPVIPSHTLDDEGYHYKIPSIPFP
ncbi:mucin-2-like [Ochlerotatus camptorhynchus]|uniref:mucin-2-like n=1 Tax=Ochlerotatus camptorhynchus TaxID=644619 RepID=UPI0031DEBB71